MASFFPFSSSSSSIDAAAKDADDPHLEVTVTPSASAFFAGETFSAVITFRNTRPAHDAVLSPGGTEAHSDSLQRPAGAQGGSKNEPLRRIGQIGKGIQSTENAEAGPSRPTNLNLRSTAKPEQGYRYPYSPGANPSSRAGWPASSTLDGAVIRSPDAWRKKEYGEVGKPGASGHTRRTKSWALGNTGMSPQEMVWALGKAPPLPARRPPTGAQIPSTHPHSRKISVTNFPGPFSPPMSPPPTDLPSIPESNSGNQLAALSRPPLSRNTSSHSSASRSQQDLPPDSRSRLQHEGQINGHGDPSYTPSPPPIHPAIRSRPPTEPRGTTTVLWAYTRLVAHFHPSNHYIPPDPLLPLRSMLLHQPIGSGSLNSSANPGLASTSSRWQLSFGTGTIGNATQPSLTGSLFGLAKDLVGGGSGGSLEEERKRVWNMKDLPVLETVKSLLGVDLKLKEGEMKEFVYTIELPTGLPPAYRGKAFRFSYDLVISLTVALGQGRKSKEISVPVRVWANLSVDHPIKAYDVLKPVIQTKEEGAVSESISTMPKSPGFSQETTGDLHTFQSHANELLGAIQSNGSGSTTHTTIPSSQDPHRITGELSPVPDHSNTAGQPDEAPQPEKRRSQDGGTVSEGDKCREAVETLSRHSTKRSYDIAKDGEPVSVLTLIKQTFRLGETVLGVVTFNDRHSHRRVLKFSAYLESHEIIPESLLPFSANSAGRAKQPHLSRLHAEHRSSYTLNTSRLAFALDIPSDATPTFAMGAGKEGYRGGLEWRVRLAFLVASPSRRRQSFARRESLDKRREHNNTVEDQSVHLMPISTSDEDNDLYAASTSLAPLLPVMEQKSPAPNDPDRDKPGTERVQIGWEEMVTEVVECEIPIQVLAGNTAFVVRPTVHAV